MALNFDPRNALEHKLLAAQDGILDSADFLTELMDLPVFLPVKDGVGIVGFQASDAAHPIVLDWAQGTQVVPVFSSPDRVQPFLPHLPGYGGGFLGEFRWVLDKLGPETGIVLNPGWDVGFEIEAAVVRAIQAGCAPG